MNVTLTCETCGTPFKRELSRWLKTGPHAYCDRECAGIGRRKGKSQTQKKQDKAEYDRQYRTKNRKRLKAIKAEWFQRTYDPEKARIYRKKIMPRHVEYCRQPRYKKWKSKYDLKYRNQRKFGAFADCAVLLAKLEKTVAARMTDYEIRKSQGTINKMQNRKRAYENTSQI